MNNPLLYLSLLALAAKIWAGYRLKLNPGIPGAGLCFIFLFIAYAQTVLEVYSYLNHSMDVKSGEILLRLYYVSFLAFLTILPFLFSNMIGKKLPLYFLLPAIFILAVFSTTVLATDWIVTGAARIKFSFTRLPGEHYWVFQLYCLTYLLFSVIFLVASYFNSNKEITKIKSANLLIGFVPLMIGLPIILILMKLDIEVNATGIVALLLSFLIAIMAENLQPFEITDFRVFLPWTRKSKVVQKLIYRPFIKVGLESEGIEKLTDKYYRAVFDEAREIFKNNKDALKWLKISESTYYRRKKGDSQP